ncbi:hypothetical protein GCM10010249_36270 [Streptomyces roseolilacinus]|uniref:Uncharacterized protein n=1 Tax=Streptomyces roseolilacinus TaxID=66904 RepID=A0A918B199_9ACTN|nr:hypothetical protein GCM10010249_36270 [Streptomyces roseolilacinus]
MPHPGLPAPGFPGPCASVPFPAVTRPPTMYTLLGAAVGVSTAYGVYLMLVWPHSP